MKLTTIKYFVDALNQLKDIKTLCKVYEIINHYECKTHTTAQWILVNIDYLDTECVDTLYNLAIQYKEDNNISTYKVFKNIEKIK